MKFLQEWKGIAKAEGKADFEFPAHVPGNIQDDYAKAKNWGDLNVGINCMRYATTEEYTWQYVTNLQFCCEEGERVFFVSNGIDYFSAISLNGTELLKNEGMFSKIEVDLTDYLKKENNQLTVTVFPHPKRTSAVKNTRDEADTSVKPPVCYGWDWHPRLLISGIWQDTYIETRKESYIQDYSFRYTLNDEMTQVNLHFDVVCSSETTVEIFDRENRLVYSGDGKNIVIQDVKLWWCSGHGDPYLYHYVITSSSDRKEGKIGFKKIVLDVYPSEWGKPPYYPMSRSNPPTCLMLNGKRIFAKGSNFVTPEIFSGNVTYDRYRELLEMVKDANMNILRMWGGCGIQKDEFFQICDELGIMIWQEFPLACNHYGVYEADNYLKVLRKEAISIVKQVSKHACLVLWCGGNELFNNWSLMTEQSLPLRLLDSVCYELNPEIPFIMTSPLSGMAHGPYSFVSSQNKDVFELFQNCSATAYTEFGVDSLSPPEFLRTFLTDEEMENRTPYTNSPWILHHAIWERAKDDEVLYKDLLGRFELPYGTVKEIYENTIWLQCEGLKGIFEETRRQNPTCWMAINWFFNEPWKVAAGRSLVLYPNVKKPSFECVKGSLRPQLISARIPQFDWHSGDIFNAELWFLNDSFGTKKISETFDATITVGDQTQSVATWSVCDQAYNLLGPTIHFRLPDVQGEKEFKLTIKARKNEALSSEYTLRYYPAKPRVRAPLKIMNDANADFFAEESSLK